MKEQLETKVLRLADALHDVDMAAGSKTAMKASRAIVNYRDTVNLCNHVKNHLQNAASLLAEDKPDLSGIMNEVNFAFGAMETAQLWAKKVGL